MVSTFICPEPMTKHSHCVSHIAESLALSFEAEAEIGVEGLERDFPAVEDWNWTAFLPLTIVPLP